MQCRCSATGAAPRRERLADDLRPWADLVRICGKERVVSSPRYPIESR
ncbi:hypothetical protein [Lysobacter gummosus]